MFFLTARKLWRLMLPAERRGLVLLMGPMFIGMAFETLGIGLIVPLLALFTQPDYVERVPALRPWLASLGNPSHETLVIGATLALIAVYTCKALFLGFLAWRQAKFAFGMQASLSQRLFAAYLRQSYTFHLLRNSAELIRNMTVEVSAVISSALIPGMLLFAESMVLIGVFVLLLCVEPLGALVVIGVLGLAAALFHRLTRRRISRWGLARQHHEGLRIQHLQQGLGGVKDVKLLGREAEFLEQFRVHNTQSAQVAQRQSALQQLPRLWLELLAVVGIATLVILMLAQGRALGAVLPTLGLFAASAFRLMPSANRIISGVQALRYGLPAIEVLLAELQPAAAAPPRAGDRNATAFRETLQLDKVAFKYPGAAAPALNDLSLTIQRGETVGFIGTSGAGKSTLVDVLLGLLAPDAGQVRVDGADIQQNLRNWQDQIGYVPQSIFLTDDTLRRNVAFGLPDARIDEEAVWHALRAAQLEDFARALPAGLETMMGERGVRLSGGQRQRIGIARALYHDPAVLVLDEATSSLDTATERGVMQSVMALRGDKTLLIVAHRLSTVERCDRLYRMEAGGIVEEGSPGSMLRVKNIAN
jgi:ATP-binding cassette, subfamily B, bacterial PglK